MNKSETIYDAPVPSEYMISSVIRRFGVTRKQLFSMGRTKNVALARQTLFWGLYRYTHMSYQDIGALMKRDHTTVMHGAKHIDQLMHNELVDGTKLLFEAKAREVAEAEQLRRSLLNKMDFSADNLQLGRHV